MSHPALPARTKADLREARLLFQSVEFCFFFLPLAYFGYLLIGRSGNSTLSVYWMIGLSLAFYGWWNPPYVLLLLGSVVFNFLIGRAIEANLKSRWATFFLIMGCAGNLLFLGHFKYTDFLIENYNWLFDTDYQVRGILLPLAISFYSFQQIAFLADTHAGLSHRPSFAKYSLFVIFFPQLIAGPIVHQREMLPQFEARDFSASSARDAAIGLSIFIIGLFKKVIIADPLAVHVNTVYGAAGGAVHFFDAWAVWAGYTFQLYFDFSAYSDMAVGLARLFGIVLPINFYSPLKSTSMIMFFQRWHITVTRFFLMYLYTPISTYLMRRSRKLPPFPQFMLIMALPMIITFLLSGLWHGAAWGYVFCLGILGLALVANHAWRFFQFPRLNWLVGGALTFATFSTSLVYFRAEEIGLAHQIFFGMFGGNGVSLPMALKAHLGAVMNPETLPVHWAHAQVSLVFIPQVILVSALVFWLPNVYQIFASSNPGLGGAGSTPDPEARAVLKWSFNAGWAAFIAALAAACILKGGVPQEFQYFQF